MFELVGFLVGGVVLLLVFGVMLKLFCFLGGLLLLPLKIVFSLAGALLTGAILLLLLPFTLVVLIAVAGAVLAAVVGAAGFLV